MNTSEALDIVRAVKTLAYVFGEVPQEFAKSLCLFYDERLPILNEAIRLHDKFIESDIVVRGKLLGLTIEKSEINLNKQALIEKEK